MTKHGLTVQIGNSVLSRETHGMKEHSRVDVYLRSLLTVARDVVSPMPP